MKKFICIMLTAVLSLSLAACSSAETPQNNGNAALSGTVSTDGSTSMEKVIGGLGEMFMEMNSGVSVSYNPTGSSAGITAVAEGRCDIGLSSRELKDSEKELGLEATALAYDGIAVIVHPENPVEDLTAAQIADLYTGKITNWSELGGADMEVVLIGREAGSGTRSGFEEIVGVEDVCQYRQELTSTGDVITTVAGNPGAVGYASLASVKDSVKALRVGGVAPSEQTIRNETYAIQRPFVLVTRADAALSPAAERFLSYITSAEAREIITAAGVVPAN